MKRAVIISGGDFSDYYIPTDNDYVIACDRGLEWAEKMGVIPNLLIGDFDSYTGERPENMETITLPHEKDDTDTNFAVKEALKRGFSEIVLICAMGGRLDHAFSNLQSCRFAAEHGVKVSIQDDSSRIWFLCGGTTNSRVTVERDDSMSVSVFSLSDECSEVSIHGTYYEVENATIKGDFPVGTSNEWDKEIADFSVGSGVLMVMLCKMK